MRTEITKLLMKLKEEIEKIEDVDEKIDTINEIKINLHEVSPISDPVDCVIWVPANKVQANEYNPNKVANPEMKLLYQSIKLDGYTMPIVTYKLENEAREVVDGFHRNRIVKEHNDIAERTFGRLPVSTINKPLDERMGSTIRHNRARGTHQIRNMSDIVLELTKYGWSDQEICKKLGMELDEVIRLKQITGLKEAFANHEFSKSWEEYEQRRKEFYAET